jgi:hypothetical protein
VSETEKQRGVCTFNFLLCVQIADLFDTFV